MIKKLLEFGNRYARQSTWLDFALTKFCLFSLGLATGMFVGSGHRNTVLVVCAAVFAATYIPLIIRMIKVARNGHQL